MGDTGSLALGAALAGVALLSKTPLYLGIIGGVFVAETLSVMIQVAAFRLTGRRVFRMSPLHHHFELGGWMESKVVFRFWIAGILLAILGWPDTFWVKGGPHGQNAASPSGSADSLCGLILLVIGVIAVGSAGAPSR